MRREVVWQRRALDDLAEIRRRDRRLGARISSAVDRYAETGRGDVRKLVGEPDRLRLRVGDYRVIFRFQDGQLIVVVLRVRNRRDAYRD